MTKKEYAQNAEASILAEGNSRPALHRGRPKGTVKPPEEKRQDTHIRLDPAILEMVRKGLERNTDPAITTKTDFIEQAIRSYYQQLSSSSGTTPPPPPAGALNNNEHSEQQTQDQDNEYITHWISEWLRIRPEMNVNVMAVFGSIQRAAQYLNAINERHVVQYGIKYAEFHLLAALRRSEPPHILTPTALFKSLLITPGAVTKQVDRLVAAGLVERIADPQDRRSVLVHLTDKGMALMDAMIASMSDREPLEIPGLNEQERQILFHLLQKMLNSIEKREELHNEQHSE